MRVIRPKLVSPVCPRCGGLCRRLGRGAGFIGLHRACCCVSGGCARLCRGDRYIPPHDERCGHFNQEGRVNSFEITFDGVDAAKCGCTEDLLMPGVWNEIVDLQLDGTYSVPQWDDDGDGDPDFFCDYLLKGVGAYHVKQWFGGSTCGEGSVLDEFQGALSIRIMNAQLDVADENFNTVFAFSNSGGTAADNFLQDLCCGDDSVPNNLVCGDSPIVASDGGTASYRPGGSGFLTTAPDPFPLSAAEWTDLKDGTTCPIKGLYRTYDFNLILDGKLSTGNLVKVEVDAEVVASATSGVWTAGTATIVGGSANLTILDQEMAWTSSGWKFTLEFRDETDNSVHTLELFRDTQSPHLCSGCWGSIEQFDNGWRMTNVEIVEGC